MVQSDQYPLDHCKVEMNYPRSATMHKCYYKTVCAQAVIFATVMRLSQMSQDIRL